MSVKLGYEVEGIELIEGARLGRATLGKTLGAELGAKEGEAVGSRSMKGGLVMKISSPLVDSSTDPDLLLDPLLLDFVANAATTEINAMIKMVASIHRMI